MSTNNLQTFFFYFSQVKRTPSKRMSYIERAQKESEELIKNMGGSLEEGGRRTRSSTRGTPTRATVTTPPPAKRSRASPASGASTPTRARGRGRKLEAAEGDSAQEEVTQTILYFCAKQLLYNIQFFCRKHLLL